MKKYWKHALALLIVVSLGFNFVDFYKSAKSGVYENGFAAGQKVGFKDGYKDGYDAGNDEGHQAGFEDGKKAGVEEGKLLGVEDGKKLGFQDGSQKTADQILAEIVRQYKTGLVQISDGSGTVYKMTPRK